MSGTNIYATFGGFPILDPAPLYEYAQREGTPTEFWGRANSFRCPRGREPGVGYVLMRRGDLHDLSDSAITPATINGKLNLNAMQRFSIYAGGASEPVVSFPSMLVTRCLCMTKQRHPGDEDSAYLVEFMDKRRVFQMSCMSLHEINPHDNVSTVSNSTSWQTMINLLWTQLTTASGFKGAAPTLPFVPTGEPENISFYGDHAWDAIINALARLACTISYNPITDVFSIVQVGDSQTIGDDTLTVSSGELPNELDGARLVYDYDPISPQGTNNPDGYRFFWSARQFHHGTQGTAGSGASSTLRPFRTDTGGTGAGKWAGSFLPVFNPTKATFNSTITPVNNATLNTIKSELENKHRDAHASINRRLRRHYGGIVTSVIPGEQISEVAWRNYGDGYGWQTEIIRGPRTESQPACMDLTSAFSAGDTSPKSETMPFTTALTTVSVGSGTTTYTESGGSNKPILPCTAFAAGIGSSAESPAWLVLESSRAVRYSTANTQWGLARLAGYHDPGIGAGERPLYRTGSFPKIWRGVVNGDGDVEICDKTLVFGDDGETGVVLSVEANFGHEPAFETGDEVYVGMAGDGYWYAIENIDRIARIEKSRHLAKLDDSLAVGGSETASLYTDSGTDTGTNVTASGLLLQEPLDSGTWVWLEEFGGTWYATGPAQMSNRHLGRLDGALTPGSTATVSLYAAVGSDTSNNVTGSGALVQEELPTDTYVWLEKFGSTWYVISPTRPGP